MDAIFPLQALKADTMRYKATLIILFEAADNEDASARAWDMSLGATNALADHYDDLGIVHAATAEREPDDDHEHEGLSAVFDALD